MLSQNHADLLRDALDYAGESGKWCTYYTADSGTRDDVDHIDNIQMSHRNDNTKWKKCNGEGSIPNVLVASKDAHSALRESAMMTRLP